MKRNIKLIINKKKYDNVEQYKQNEKIINNKYEIDNIDITDDKNNIIIIDFIYILSYLSKIIIKYKFIILIIIFFFIYNYFT